MSTAEEKALSFTGPLSFGGPKSINVVLDKGQSGERGTYFLLANGDPNITSTTIVNSYINSDSPLIPIIASVNRRDVCIDLNPLSPGYMKLYQYRHPDVNVPAETEIKWYEVIKLTPSSFPYISGRAENGSLDVVFTAGAADLPLPPIPIPDLLWPTVAAAAASSNPQDMINLKTNLLANVINIQHNIINNKPIVSNVITDPAPPSLDSVSFDLTNKTVSLGLNIYGYEYSSGTWSPLSGEKTVHLLIGIDI